MTPPLPPPPLPLPPWPQVQKPGEVARAERQESGMLDEDLVAAITAYQVGGRGRESVGGCGRV